MEMKNISFPPQYKKIYLKWEKKLNIKGFTWLLCDVVLHFSRHTVQYLKSIYSQGDRKGKSFNSKIILLGVIVVVIKKLLTK